MEVLLVLHLGHCVGLSVAHPLLGYEVWEFKGTRSAALVGGPAQSRLCAAGGMQLCVALAAQLPGV